MTNIFIETGKELSNESQFIQTVLNKFLSKKSVIDYKLVNVGGFTSLGNFQNELSEGNKNLLVFDADYPETDGGYKQRSDWLLAQKQLFGVDFELFLFPNNQDDGIFETLLQRIINPEYTPMIGFFKEYEEKVKTYNEGLSQDTFKTPDEKARIYSYISAFKRTKAENEKFKNKAFWNFENSKYWNLEADGLVPLATFFRNFVV